MAEIQNYQISTGGIKRLVVTVKGISWVHYSFLGTTPITTKDTYLTFFNMLMKTSAFVLISLALNITTTAAKNDDTITKFVSQVNTDGTYGFDIAQSSGLNFKEVGYGGHFAKGSYQYVSPEGQHISVVYTADENGYHPESDSIPTPPPIPAYILKALDYIRDHPTPEELADRKVRAKQT